jgi:hypothetical protein
MALAQVNARITKVAKQGSTDSWRDSDDADDDEVWIGETDAYYMTKRVRVQDGGNSTLLIDRTLIVSTRDPEVVWQSEQIVTFLFAGDEQTGKILDVEVRSLRAAGQTETTRLTLEPM